MSEETLVLRLAGPAQSWAGYRASFTKTVSEPIPTKSGIAGLIGACTGHKNYRDLLNQFDLHIRVDSVNPPAMDLQVSSPPTEGTKEFESMGRTISLHSGKPSTPPSSFTGGTLATSLAYRGLIPYSEFVAFVTTAHAHEWLPAFHRPTYMPFLGRMSHPPTYPFVLGRTPLRPDSISEQLPTMGDTTPLPVYHVTDSYQDAGATARQLTSWVTPPPARNRAEQLLWAKENLTS